MNWIETLSTDLKVIICKHVIAYPSDLICVYHSDDGVISMLCDRDPDMLSGSDVTWTHAGHLNAQFPHLKKLPKVPPGSMGYFFRDQDVWAVEEML